MIIPVKLPILHAGQIDIFKQRTRLNVVRCGRRFGKTRMMTTLAGDATAKGRKVGIFTPEYKQLSEPFDELRETLAPITKSVSAANGKLRTINGGKLDFWTLTDNELAGRGREYDLVLIDEGAFTKNGQMLNIWKKSIKPTMLTTKGTAWVYSTPNGDNPENFFHAICNDPAYGFKEFYAPSSANPYVPPDELEKERISNHPDVFRQEFLAQWVDWRGAAFFGEQSMLVDGHPVQYPAHCDQVYAVMDTALKDGLEHDGSAVTFFAKNKYVGIPLIILDYDVIQIEGASLEQWLPQVNARLEELAKLCNARQGSAGIFIEDKASGIVLIQQAQRKGLPAYPISGDLTAMGKDGRALNVSGYVFRGEVKFSEYAHNKVVTYKGQSRNHLISQVCGYRMGVKTPHGMDIFDTFCYGVAIGLGDTKGY